MCVRGECMCVRGECMCVRGECMYVREGSSLLPTTELAFFTSLSMRLQCFSLVQLPQQTTA